MFTFYQKLILIDILKEHKEQTKDLPNCFRDDKEVDEMLGILRNEVEKCQKQQ